MQTIFLPRNLNARTLAGIYRNLKLLPSNTRKYFTIDFKHLNFADPPGIVGLAAAIAGISNSGAEVFLEYKDCHQEAVNYLRDAGFFKMFEGEALESNGRKRATTIPFTEIRNASHVAFIHMRLKPWLGYEINLSEDTLEALCSCIAEALQNIEHHGGELGFAIAQHYPKKKELHISAADIGKGIPHLVREKIPGISDQAALRQACVRGFTTKNNYTNRGFGLDNLILYTVGKNRGKVILRSGAAALEANPVKEGTALNTYATDWTIPGTIVHIILRADTLEQSDELVKSEVFQW